MTEVDPLINQEQYELVVRSHALAFLLTMANSATYGAKGYIKDPEIVDHYDVLDWTDNKFAHQYPHSVLEYTSNHPTPAIWNEINEEPERALFSMSSGCFCLDVADEARRIAGADADPRPISFGKNGAPKLEPEQLPSKITN